jgi:sortase (surface protein transpeptidase)
MKALLRSNVAILESTGGEILTLVTCHPFCFVGRAPNPLMVRAARVRGAVT